MCSVRCVAGYGGCGSFGVCGVCLCRSLFVAWFVSEKCGGNNRSGRHAQSDRYKMNEEPSATRGEVKQQQQLAPKLVSNVVHGSKSGGKIVRRRPTISSVGI